MSAYEELKKGMAELAIIQDALLHEQPVHGVRHILPLEGREIMVIHYAGKPTDPALFCCYGGGFIMGSAVGDDACWTELRDTLGVNLFSIAYRKAPEHPFPCALYDVYDSIAYIQQHQAQFGIETEDLSVYGFSAGGNLAAAVCLLDAQRGNQLHIRCQVLNYPYLDLATSPEEKGHPEMDRLIYHLFPEYYCGLKDPKEPLISPMYTSVESLQGLPRAIVIMGEADPLHAEDARYVCKLRTAGVDVRTWIGMDMPHGYIETAYQQPGPYLAPKATRQLLSGILEREKNKAFAFLKENFPDADE